jgi:hypothetical protein
VTPARLTISPVLTNGGRTRMAESRECWAECAGVMELPEPIEADERRAGSCPDLTLTDRT